MPITFEDLETMTFEEKREWERLHSSLFLSKGNDASYEECRGFSCQDIANGLTKIKRLKKGMIVDIPQGTPFHLIGRVDTTHEKNKPAKYYKSFIDRDFISFTVITNRNVSHYLGDIFFLYKLQPRDIVHVFPMDSSTNMQATEEKSLTVLPSLWVTLSKLESLSEELGVYNQVTARTKRGGKIIKPYAIATFGSVNESVQRAAARFRRGIVVLHPDADAISYEKDLLCDLHKLSSVSSILEGRYGFSTESLFCGF